jgi:alkylated DNA repair dioxygenase AlkB
MESPDGEALLRNRLPRDGSVYYFPDLFSPEEQSELFAALLTGIAWEHDEVQLFGKKIVTARKVAWYGDEAFPYTYSRTTRVALPWTDPLLRIRERTLTRVPAMSAMPLNACLLNLYHHGGEGMGWHSDDESSLVPDSTIASVSFGAARRFDLRHRENFAQKVSILLESGSLLLMVGPTQSHWQHALPKALRVTEARINLTFRTMKTNP